jgi:uncharacterized membrane protein YkvA (DUF1232 family)
MDLPSFLWYVLAVMLAGLLLLVALAAFLYWRIQTSDEKKLARRIGKLQFLEKIALAGSIFRDQRIPIAPRIVALALVLYIASPIDLIPDFIPILGFFDDILIVLIGAGLLLRNIPDYIVEEHLTRYELRNDPDVKQLPSPRR